MRVQHSVVIDGAAARFGSATPTGSLERRAGLSRAEFVAEYQTPRRPVILTDAARAWPLYEQGSPDYFRARYGTHKVHVRGIQYRLADLLDLLEASTEEAPSPYPCRFSIPHEFRDLLSEISPRFEYSLPDRQANPLVPKRLFQHVNNLEIWPAFVGDVVAGERRSKPVRTWALADYLRAIDPLLSAAERFGVNQSTRWGKR